MKNIDTLQPYNLSTHLNNPDINKTFSDLQGRGFSCWFKLKDECVSWEDYNIGFEELEVAEFHRFEIEAVGAYNTLYAITCNKYSLKGVIITASETYANAFSNVFIGKIIEYKEFSYRYYVFN
jgi:hypothetical protein